MKSITRRSSLLILFAFPILWIVHNGYQYGAYDHPYFIPSIYRLADPAFLPTSWVINICLSYHHIFTTFYAKLLMFVPLPTLFAISFFFTLLMYCYGIKRLSFALFESHTHWLYALPFVTVWTLLGLGAYNIMKSNTYGMVPLALSISMIAVAFFFEERIMLSFIVAGIATYAHTLIGLDLVAALILTLCFYHFRSPRTLIRKVLGPSILYGIIVCGAIYVEMTLYLSDKAVGNNFFIEAIKFRAPQHLFVRYFSGVALEFLLLLMMGLSTFIYCGMHKGRRLIIAFFGAFLSLMLFQVIVTEIIPHNFLMKFAFYRISGFMGLICVLYIARFVQITFETKKNVLYSIFCLAIAVSQSIALSCGLLYLIRYVKKKWQSCVLLVIIIAGCTLGIFALWHHSPKLFSYTIERFLTKNHALPLCAIAAVIAYLMFGVLRIPRNVHTFLIASILIICCGCLIIRPPFNIGLRKDGKWYSVCNWVKYNVPDTALFLTPLYMQGFIMYAHRDTLVDFKNYPLAEHDMLEWKKRIEFVTGLENLYSGPRGFSFLPVLHTAYDSIDKKRVCAIQKKYGITHVITRTNAAPLPFVKIYEDPFFIVYDLTQQLTTKETL